MNMQSAALGRNKTLTNIKNMRRLELQLISIDKEQNEKRITYKVIRLSATLAPALENGTSYAMIQDSQALLAS